MAVFGMCSGWFDNSDGPLRQSDVPWGKLNELWSESETSVAAAAWSDSAPSSQPFRGRSHWEGTPQRRTEHAPDSDAAVFASVFPKE
jgi:hypothetical protein